MPTPAEEPENEIENKGTSTLLANNAASTADTLKVLVLLAVLVLASCAGAYIISAHKTDDNKVYDSNNSVNHNQTAIIAPQLVCVMRRAPAYGKKGEVAYSPCNCLVYYAEPDSFDPNVPYDIRGVKIVVGFEVNETSPGDSGDSGDDDGEYYSKLASWLGKKYAVMDLKIASDFSNAAAARRRVHDALAMIKKERGRPELAVLGVVVAAKDEDATRENGEKLDEIAKGALIVFQAHISSQVADGPCEMRLNEVVITKKNYEKLAEGVSGPVALSTTVAVVQFEPSDRERTDAGDKCDAFQLMNRNDRVCGAFSKPMSDSGRSVQNGFVYAYNTNASVQALLVVNTTHPTASWKFNIAFFDVDRYFPQNDTKCPPLKLANFYREGPRKLPTISE